METQVKTPQAARSLTTTLAIAFFALSAVVLLVSSGLQIFSGIQTQQKIIASQQRLIAQDAAKEVSNDIQEKFSVLTTVAKLANPAKTLPAAQQQAVDSLVGLQPAFRQLVLLNAQGQVSVEASRLSQAAAGRLSDRLNSAILAQVRQGQPYISTVYIDEVTSEPLIILAVPATNALGDFQGMLAAEVNLKFMWDLVDRLKV